MNIEDLLKCSAVLSAVGSNFAAIPGNEKAGEAAAYFSIVNSYVAELAHHLSNGVDAFDALERTANGELTLKPSQSTLFKILAAKPKD